MTNYDIIGDIHGHAMELIVLLEKLGYEKQSGTYKHSERIPIFTGDFIDRGMHNEDVINIVRPMVDSGSAHAVMGNHEYNAICYHTNDPETGTPLREHSHKNTLQHQSFIKEFEGKPEKLKETISWFMTLPLFIELNGIRIVHAEWNQSFIDISSPLLRGRDRLTDEYLWLSAKKGSDENLVIETLLKGSEMNFPNGISFNDKDGHVRNEGRVKWWEQNPVPANMFMVPDDLIEQLAELDNIDMDLTPYGFENPPVFFGHYWLSGKPAVQSNNAICVDYSVGKPGGKLCCYRHNGNDRLSADNFVYVNRFDG